MIVKKSINKKCSVIQSKIRGGGINYYDPKVLTAVKAFQTNNPLGENPLTHEYVQNAKQHFQSKSNANQSAALRKFFKITESNTNSNLSSQIAKQYADNTRAKANAANTLLGKQIKQQQLELKSRGVISGPILPSFQRRSQNTLPPPKKWYSRVGKSIKKKLLKVCLQN
jgi:hypothetical protein